MSTVVKFRRTHRERLRDLSIQRKRVAVMATEKVEHPNFKSPSYTELFHNKLKERGLEIIEDIYAETISEINQELEKK